MLQRGGETINIKKGPASPITARLHWVGICIGILYWFLESLLDSFLFHQGSLAERIFAPDPNELWMRLLVTLILIVSWLYYKVIIDKYKKAQDSLKESEAYLRSLVETSASVIICLSSDHRIIEFNQEAERLYGMKREEVLGKDYFELFLPKSVWDQVATDIRKVLGGEPTRGYENPVRATDGSERILHWSVSRISVGEGKFGIMAVGQDITELRKAKEELENSVSLLRATIESTADGILVVNNEGKMVSFNQRFVDMWGIPESILSTRDHCKLLEFVKNQLKDPEYFLSKVRDLLSQPDTAGYAIWELKDGRIFERYTQPQRIGGKSVGRVVSHRDITMRKKAENEIQRLNEELERRVMDRTKELALANEGLKMQIAERNRAENRLITQHAISRILAESTSLDVATPRIVRAVCENLGWDMGAIWMVDRRLNLLSCVDHWHLPSIDVAEFEAITRGFRFSHGEGMPGRIWASGKPEWITDAAGDPSFLRAVYAERAGLHSVFGFPIKLGGDILGVIEFLSREVSCPDRDMLDIFDSIGSQIGQFAERKLAEEKVMASLNEKEVLLHEVYHRVKNNVQIISSLLSLQSRYIKDKNTAELFLDCRNRIRSMALVHEMLYQSDNLAKINSKDYIKNLLDGILNAYKEYSDNINIDVSLDEVSLRPDSAIPLGFIINELVVNSIKHAFPQDRLHKEKRGEITIQFRSIGQEMVALIVKDNGVGLPEDLDIDKSESIGLKLVNLLAKQMEGKVQILKKDGTEFRIEFKGRDL